MNEISPFLEPLIGQYIAFQEASGRWRSGYIDSLRSFGRHCLLNFPGASELSQEMADSWFAKRSTETINSCISRSYPLASFIAYLKTRGLADIEVPDMPRAVPRKYIPHAFSQEELENFFAACDSIEAKTANKAHHSRRITVPVFFRLLYSSGMRPYEARMLMREDIDLSSGAVNIRKPKGHAQHFAVLHESMLALLRQYGAAIDKIYPNRAYFFPYGESGHLPSRWAARNFKEMWVQANAGNAVPYALRHNYAVENINSWQGEWFGLHSKLLSLSKSMGHSSVESTKYYYSLTPQLACILEEKTDEAETIPEARYESIE